MMKKLQFVVLAFGLLSSSAAVAQVGQSAGFQSVRKGAFDLSFDNSLAFKSVSSEIGGTNVSTSSFDFLLGVTPKYFLVENYYIGVNLNFAYANASTSIEGNSELDSTSSDLGFLGFVDTGYYLRLGNSFFLAPKVGFGYFVGTRERPAVGGMDNVRVESSLGAIAGRAGLDAVFWAGRQWNLRAGASFIFRSGSESPGDGQGDDIDFTLLDAFYSVGMGYTF